MKYFVFVLFTLLFLFLVSNNAQSAPVDYKMDMRHSTPTADQVKQPIIHKLPLPKMPPHCDTPKTMNIWYAEVAKQSGEEHHTIVACINELRKLGAAADITRIACKAP